MKEPQLTWFHEVESPSGVVLMLHGGQERSHQPVENKHASWWRMALIAKSLRPLADRHNLGVVLLQYRLRGWNDHSNPDPVADARWALERLRAAHPGLPIALVGHSMGGRTACRVADDRVVEGVCALAPWLPQGEPNETLRGKHLRVLHGTADKWTSARWSKDFVERTQEVAASATWAPMPRVGHFMLRKVGKWNRFVSDSVAQQLGLDETTGVVTEGSE